MSKTSFCDLCVIVYCLVHSVALCSYTERKKVHDVFNTNSNPLFWRYGSVVIGNV